MWPAQSIRLSVLALTLVASGAATPAVALDLDGLGGLDTSTVASRDRLRFYDNAKKYGAEAIGDRGRSDYSPDGIRIGSFIVFPSAHETVTLDDNVFATNTFRRSDLVSALEPTLRLQSQFARHSLSFATGASIFTYARNSDLDHINAFGQASGSLHIDNAHTLSALVHSGIDHELPSDPGVPQNAAKPVEILRSRASVGFTRDVGRLYGTISGTVQSLDYRDTTSREGLPLDQDSRDMTTYSADLRLGYRISPGYEFVTKLRGVRQSNRGTAERDLDASGYEAMAGIAGELNPLVRWRLLGGMGVRDFDQANLASITTSLVEGKVTWLATQLLTVHLSADRAISDTADIQGTGRIDSSVKARAEYEVWRNLVLSGELQYRQSEFTGITREDRTYSGRLGVDYWLNKNVMFTFSYEHQERQSNLQDFDLTRNKVSIGAKLRF